MRFFIVISIFFVLCTSYGSYDVFAYSSLRDDVFPKTANYFLKWELTDAEAISLAKYDLLILDMEVQEKSREQLVRIREINPDITILAYITSQEIMTNAGTSYSTLRRELASGVQSSWYLKNTQGKKLSWWQGTYMFDMTNTSGWPSYLAQFIETRILSTGLWDGVFLDNTWDNVTYFVGIDIDLNGDGKKESRSYIDTAWQQGMKYLYQTVTDIDNGAYLVVGNGTTNKYAGQLNGQMIENFSEVDTWKNNMETYALFDDMQQSPRVNILNMNTENTYKPGDYQRMRFGLTSSLLEDGYYSFDYGDQNHGQTWWYDEYDVDLGDALTESQSLAGHTQYAPDVWKRDFERGVSLVNSTEHVQQVELEGIYEKIHGEQDTSVNTGEIVEEVTLSPEDGLILLKTFQDLDNIAFTNGQFARFFHPDGSRVRNGIFLFTEDQPGGVQLIRIDLNRNDLPELVRIRGSKVEIYRDDGYLYSRFFPYGADYEGELRIAFGDLFGILFQEIFIAPSEGYMLPIRSYSYFGNQMREDWYPFGEEYDGGYSLASGHFASPIQDHIAIGKGSGEDPEVVLFDHHLKKYDAWFAYEYGFRGGVFVAAGDTDGDGVDEVVTGPGPGKSPHIRVFSYSGVLSSEFTAYSTPLTPGIRVQTADLDFDGKDDIVGLSDGF